MHLSLFHLPLPKTSVTEHPVFLLLVSYTIKISLGDAGFHRLVFLLVTELPALLFWLFFYYFLQNCDLHLGWLPGWFSRTFLQNIHRSIIRTDVIPHISFSAESPDSSKMGKCCSVIIVESLTETDRSKPESQSAWWKTLQNHSVWTFLAQIWLQQVHNFLTKEICNWFPQSCLQPFRNSSSAPLSLY